MGLFPSLVLVKNPAPDSGFPLNFDTLTDGFSMQDLYLLERGHHFNGTVQKDAANRRPICGSKSAELYREQTYSAVERALKYYENDAQNITENGLVFTFLKGVDDKHEKKLQKTFPLGNMLKEFCDNNVDSQLIETCRTATSSWKPGALKWKSDSAIQRYLPSSNDQTFGNEKEFMWRKLNEQCQQALLQRCEVPYVCERTYFDPTPHSQYFLTHQLLQRILVQQMDCSAVKHFIDENLNEKMCAKMYAEAQLISAMDYPIVMRDLFSEYVAVCGYLGYPNFIREDWLQKILSWQSRSDYGCFVRDKADQGKFVMSDVAIPRKTTEAESAVGLISEESCLPHFTAVGVMALAVNLDYLEDHC